jgi:UDP-2,3-diacylglucosamine pyrophosphatase LpxH
LHKEVPLLDAILLSDLHLGSESCQVLEVLEFLETLPDTQRLILNGDVLENTEYRLTKQHWRVLSRLRKLSDNLELVWVRGNHDFDAESVAHLIGAKFVPEYMFESGGKKILCVHGDAWDRFLTDHPIITTVVDWFYLYMQRLSRRLATRAKRSSKTFLRCVELIRTKAIEYGTAREADIVICGHTHQAEPPAGDVPSQPAYCNTGCWTDHHCHYVTVQDGRVELGIANQESAVRIELPAEPAGENRREEQMHLQTS